jgi:hypothetical protein
MQQLMEEGLQNKLMGVAGVNIRVKNVWVVGVWIVPFVSRLRKSIL